MLTIEAVVWGSPLLNLGTDDKFLVTQAFSANFDHETRHCFFLFQLRQCFLTSGQYPDSLLDLWDQFDEERGSENDRPGQNYFTSWHWNLCNLTRD